MPRKEGVRKVTGQAQYVDDLQFPGMIHGATVRNPARRGKIRSITFEPGIPWDEFTIVTAKDVPGKNFVALILNDQPFLADEITAHAEEAIVLLAHPDRYLVEEARRHVRIEIDPLPCVDSLDEAIAKKEIVWGDDNILKSYLMNKGDVDAGLRRSRPHRRRRVRNRRPGAALHRKQRHDRRRESARRRHRLGLHAVPLLRPQSAHAAVRPAA